MRKTSALSYLLLSSLAVFLISSCQKEPSTDSSPETNCLLVKTHYFDYVGALADSLEYTYINDKLMKASNVGGYITFEYTNEKITKRNYYATGSTDLDAYDIATYNTDGSLAIIKSYFNFNGQIMPSEQYEFNYANGKLVKFELKDYNSNTSQFELNESTTYTYTGNNITQSVSITAGTSEIDTSNYSHDDNENYLVKINALFADLAFVGGLNGETIPLLLSVNNVTKVFEGNDEYLLTYKLDSKNNFFEWHLDGDLASRYFYDCK
ncbi:MAG TPA: hypothetical protein VJ111_09390 [Chitinophagaceae bacterium]|nr:hypothetical protein [Chitinophagaceae bacterium]